MRSRGDDADLPEDVLRVRPGAALAAVAGELALDQVRLQIEEEEDLGVDLAGTPTLATLKDGLKACFTHLGRDRAVRPA